MSILGNVNEDLRNMGVKESFGSWKEVAYWFVTKWASKGIVDIINFILGAIFWTYSINSWLQFFGEPMYIPWYVCGFLGILPVFSGLTLSAAVITLVLMIVL